MLRRVESPRVCQTDRTNQLSQYWLTRRSPVWHYFAGFDRMSKPLPHYSAEDVLKVKGPERFRNVQAHALGIALVKIMTSYDLTCQDTPVWLGIVPGEKFRGRKRQDWGLGIVMLRNNRVSFAIYQEFRDILVDLANKVLEVNGVRLNIPEHPRKFQA